MDPVHVFFGSDTFVSWKRIVKNVKKDAKNRAYVTQKCLLATDKDLRYENCF